MWYPSIFLPCSSCWSLEKAKSRYYLNGSNLIKSMIVFKRMRITEKKKRKKKGSIYVNEKNIFLDYQKSESQKVEGSSTKDAGVQSITRRRRPMAIYRRSHSDGCRQPRVRWAEATLVMWLSRQVLDFSIGKKIGKKIKV